LRVFPFRASSGVPADDPAGRRPFPPTGLLGLLVLWALLPASGHAQFPGELHGRVLDARTGEPIAGVRVEAEGTGLGVLSEGDGRFRIRGLDEGPVRVRGQRYGYLAAWVDARIRNGASTSLTLRMEPQPVRVGGVRVEGGRPAPNPVVSLSRQEIQASGARTVGELLEGIPGVVVVRRGPGGSSSIQIRGAGANQVLVLVDGHRVNDPVTGAADLSLIPLADVEHVEVLAGALGARFGPGALGGVVRVVTGGTASGAEASARVGSLGERGASAAAAVPVGRARLEAGADGERARGAFDFPLPPEVGGRDRRRTNGDHRREGGHVGLRGPLGGGSGSVRVRADRWDRGVPGKGFAPADSARQEEERLRAGGSWHAPLPGAEIRLRAGWERRSARFHDPAPPLGPPFDQRTELHAGDALLELEGAPRGPQGLRLGGGAEVRTQRLRSDALGLEGALRRTDLSLRAHGESPAFDLPLSPVLGVALSADRDGDRWVLSHDLTLRASAGPARLHMAHRSAHSPPSAGDQFFREGVGVAPNPDLRAERVREELEAGATLLLRVPGGDLLLSGAAFRGDLEDMIVWAPDFRFVWSPRNQDVRRRGGELRAELRHLSGLRIGGHWTRASTTYDRGASAPAVQVIYRPRDTGGVRVGAERRGWRGELAARYTGVRYPVPARVNALEPFWTLDATVSGSVRVGGWDIRPLLRVDRLRDERASFIFAVPEPGRTLSAELRLRRLP
jgi:vitamin B12 transporter